jgi:hypothetical protein
MDHCNTSQEKAAVALAYAIVEAAAAPRTSAGTAWSAADLVWERGQEQAAIAFRAGDPFMSSRLWAETLAVARKCFGRGDPRLASSLTNQALVLRRRRQDYQAMTMFQEAVAAWDDSWRWIHLMTPGPAGIGPRHGDHLGVYGPQARARFSALAQKGRDATIALERYDRRLEVGIDAWFAIKPKQVSDLRRLLGAVLLIAPRPRP